MFELSSSLTIRYNPRPIWVHLCRGTLEELVVPPGRMLAGIQAHRKWVIRIHEVLPLHSIVTQMRSAPGILIRASAILNQRTYDRLAGAAF